MARLPPVFYVRTAYYFKSYRKVERWRTNHRVDW